jgi:hypothetical protein
MDVAIIYNIIQAIGVIAVAHIVREYEREHKKCTTYNWSQSM